MVTKKGSPTLKEKQSSEMKELRAQLAEANETLRAIREGDVDAVIVSGSQGEQVFSLVGAESIYRLIVETMKEAAFTVTFEGQILYCNAQFGEFIRLPTDQILGHRLNEFVDPANRSVADALLITAQEKSVKRRLVFADADGSLMPAHISANLLNQPDGMSICVVATDLTELENSTEMIQRLRSQQEALQEANEELAATEEELRVQMEELAASRAELDHTRERYQDLFETAPDGYIGTDAEGIIQEANGAASRLFGRRATELIGNPFSSLLPISEREAYFNLLACVSTGEVPTDWELELRPLNDRSPFWAAVTAAASHDDEGNVIGLRLLIRDVTERKKSEIALRESEERFRSLFESSPDAVFLTIPDGGVIAANPAACAMFGWTEQELCEIGRPGVIDLDDQRLPAAMEERQRAGRIQGWELTATGKNGEKFPVEVDSVILPGELVRSFVIVRDITERKRAALALREANADLEQKVQQRTSELSQRADQLRTLTGELVLAEQRERKRIAKVLHDHIQQLLVAAKFQVYILNKDGNDSVKQATKQVLELIDESIAATRTLTIELSPYVLHTSGLNAALEWLAKQMAEKQGLLVNLEMDVTEPLPEVTRILLFESVRELLFNVVKHSHTHSATVNLKTADGALQLVVSDQGVGFDSGIMTLAGESGRGFGLFSIRERLELIGGNLVIESAPGKGSRFTLSVPATQPDIRHSAEVIASVRTAVPRGTPGKDTGSG